MPAATYTCQSYDGRTCRVTADVCTPIYKIKFLALKKFRMPIKEIIGEDRINGTPKVKPPHPEELAAAPNPLVEIPAVRTIPTIRSFPARIQENPPVSVMVAAAPSNGHIYSLHEACARTCSLVEVVNNHTVTWYTPHALKTGT